MRLVVDAEIPDGEAAFAGFGDVTLAAGRELGPRDVRGADILLVRSVTRVDRFLLENSKVRIVGTATAGIDHLDTDYLERRGIEHFNAAGCNARAVAEYVLAGILQSGVRAPDGGVPRVGIVGYGHVGKALAALLDTIDLPYVVNDPPLASHQGVNDFVDLSEILRCDVVTLHTPLVEAGAYPTRKLVDERALQQLRDGALLINAARGGIVDEAALTHHVDRLHVILDCWIDEPCVDAKLLQMVNIATPHIAGHTREARLGATSILVQRLGDMLRHPNAWSPGVLEPIDLKLETHPSGSTFDVLHGAVIQCCDPVSATVPMRLSLGLALRERAREFDRLRVRALSRRQFCGHRVATAGLQSDTVEMLSQLGFQTR